MPRNSSKLLGMDICRCRDDIRIRRHVKSVIQGCDAGPEVPGKLVRSAWCSVGHDDLVHERCKVLDTDPSHPTGTQHHDPHDDHSLSRPEPAL